MTNNIDEQITNTHLFFKVIDEKDNVFFEVLEVPDDMKINSTYCTPCFTIAMTQAKIDGQVFKQV